MHECRVVWFFWLTVYIEWYGIKSIANSWHETYSRSLSGPSLFSSPWWKDAEVYQWCLAGSRSTTPYRPAGQCVTGAFLGPRRWIRRRSCGGAPGICKDSTKRRQISLETAVLALPTGGRRSVNPPTGTAASARSRPKNWPESNRKIRWLFRYRTTAVLKRLEGGGCNAKTMGGRIQAKFQ